MNGVKNGAFSGMLTECRGLLKLTRIRFTVDGAFENILRNSLSLRELTAWNAFSAPSSNERKEELMLFVGISERVADVTVLSQLGISKPLWNFGLIGIHISFLFLSSFLTPLNPL